MLLGGLYELPELVALCLVLGTFKTSEVLFLTSEGREALNCIIEDWSEYPLFKLESLGLIIFMEALEILGLIIFTVEDRTGSFFFGYENSNILKLFCLCSDFGTMIALLFLLFYLTELK